MVEPEYAAVIGQGPIQYRESPHQARGDRYNQFVHQTCLDETADDLAAAFHHDAPYPSFTEDTEQITKIYPASVIPTAANDFRPLLHGFVNS
jgi:hypothetical protein